MADRLTEMEVFLKAVETGSFAAAASRLGLSPQMVGKRIATIEQRLGARLLNRSRRRQSLTEAGLLYLGGCRRTLAEADAIGELPDSTLVARALAPYRLILCASLDYLARRGLPEHPAELRGHECLDYAFPAHPAPAIWRFRSRGPTIAIEPTGRLLVNDSRALIEAALRGLGVILLAELLVAGGDLDESPMTYRRLPNVLAQHAGTIRVLHTLRPFAVAMAADGEFDPFKY